MQRVSRAAQRVVNVRLPSDLLHLLDQIVEQGHFSTRSDAIRHFSRAYVRRHGGQQWRRS